MTPDLERAFVERMRGLGLSDQSIAYALSPAESAAQAVELDELLHSQEVSEERGGKRLDAAACDQRSADPGPHAAKALITCLADVRPEPVSWLWPGRIPRRKLTFFDGDPGTNKTWLALAVGAAVTRGFALPGGEPGRPENILFLTFEDGLADTLRPRFDALDGDADRFFAVQNWQDERGLERGPVNAKQLDLLEAEIERLRAGLLVIDPITAFLGAGVDMHRANEVRPVLARLAQLAERRDLAVVAIRHLRKAGADHAIHRGLGSVDFAAAARSVLLLARDPDREDDPAARVVAQVKSSLGPLAPSLAFTLDGGRFAWRGESRRTAGELLAAPSTPEDRGRMAEAEAFLRDQLADGPRVAGELIAEAKATGIAERTLKRARKAIGATTRKVPEGWQWCPPKQGANPDEQTGQAQKAGPLAPSSPADTQGATTNQQAKGSTPTRAREEVEE